MAVAATPSVHEKYGHLNDKDLSKLSRHQMVTGLDTPSQSSEFCESCAIGKAKRGTPPQVSSSHASSPAELFHSDLCGPLEPSRSGARFILTFTDDHSRYSFVFLMKTKSETFSKFLQLDNLIYNKFARHITTLRSDNGTEYNNSNFAEYCNAYGISHQFTTPYASNQNGVSERLNLTLLNGVRTLLHASGQPNTLWDEAVMTTVYTRNRSPHSKTGLKTPYELFHGIKPDVSKHQAFGAPCYAITTPYYRRNTGSFKLASRSQPGTFVGYSHNSKSYRLLLPSGDIVLARFEDVIFPLTPPTSPGELVTGPPAVKLLSPATINPSTSDESDAELSFYSVESESDGVQESPSPPSSPNLLPPRRSLRTLPRIDYSSAFSTSSHPYVAPDHTEVCTTATSDALCHSSMQWFKLPPAYALSATHTPLPTSYNDILALADKDEWLQATDAEIASLIEHGTWELVPLPAGRRALKNKWVFRLKTDESGNVTRYKARLCACGYNQVAGIDYKEIFSPVVRTESFRMFLALVAGRDMDCIQMDVVTAFLNGSVEEDVYMRQPPGYEDPACPDHVCRIIKNLYGLKQAPRVWHKTIDPFLKSLGFQPLAADPCLYYQWTDGKLSLISLYVDDLAIASDSPSTIAHIRSRLMQQFKMTDEGELHYILGMKITRDRSTKAIFVSSSTKIEEILNDFYMSKCIPCPTPMEHVAISASDCPTVGSDAWHSMQKVPYRECVGRLTHLMRTTRPDLAFSVSVVNRYLHNPGPRHWEAVKRILRYLKGTLNLVIRIAPGDFSTTVSAVDRCPKSSPDSLPLTGNTDADWGGHPESFKSTSGYAFFLGSGLVSWSSKVQPHTATSSTHAEYIAAYHATSECMWARSFLGELGLLNLSLPTTLYCDNEAAIKIANYHMVTPRSKHFNTKLHCVREKVQDGELSLSFCPGKANVADIFTKPLVAAKFLPFRKELGLVESSVHVKSSQ
jgi:hypothetical protein